MARPRINTINTIVIGVVAIVFLHAILPTSATNTDQCTKTPKKCRCSFAHGANDLPVDSFVGEEEDRRSVGLAGATGALGGVIATGSALAAYFHFRGSGGGGGGGGSGGVPGAGGPTDFGRGGRGGGGGGGRVPSSPRPDSTESSADSYGSESPLTKRDNRMYEPRFRPFSTASSHSSTIYRQAKVWPGRRF